MGIDYKQKMKDQGYKKNNTASICRNCALATLQSSIDPSKGHPVMRAICSVGRFRINPEGTCDSFKPKHYVLGNSSDVQVPPTQAAIAPR